MKQSQLPLKNFRRPRLRSLINFLFLIFGVAGFMTLFIMLENSKFTIPNRTYQLHEATATKQQNYFLKIKMLEEQGLGLLINTSSCKIPNFSPWDPEIIPVYHKAIPYEDCANTHFNWSFTEHRHLIINSRQIEIDGYSFTNGFCCYQQITRVLEDPNLYTEDADTSLRYSSCISITEEVTLISEAEFIIVQCGGWTGKKGIIPYRGFHAIAQEHSNRISSSIRNWNATDKPPKETTPTPPNILVLGLDSTSRINVQRSMLKTVEVLNSFGAVEMLGYTKVGSNTFPNFMPIFTGYSEDDIRKTCNPTDDVKLDDCPFIWERFHDANYLTGFSEDSPILAAFNFLKVGFVQQPVDFYLRPLFLSAHDFGYPPFHAVRKDHMDCVGQETADESVLSYVNSQFEFASNKTTPLFSFTWSTTTTHEDLNMLQVLDKTYEDFLLKFKAKGHLENTILILVGDHGYRYGPLRNTLVGYYENKLPAMWIYLPPAVSKLHPEWKDALAINKRRLTSPFNLYATLNHILSTFTPTKPLPDIPFLNETGGIAHRKQVESFFQTMPENRSCDDLGIPGEFCPCHLIQAVEISNDLLREAAINAIEYINSRISVAPLCLPLSLKEVTSGAVMDISTTVQKFIVGFTTELGNFGIEAEIDFYPAKGAFSKYPAIQRSSKINQDHIHCVRSTFLELYCFCKP